MCKRIEFKEWSAVRADGMRDFLGMVNLSKRDAIFIVANGGALDNVEHGEFIETESEVDAQFAWIE